jgi:hypothetical protein
MWFHLGLFYHVNMRFLDKKFNYFPYKKIMITFMTHMEKKKNNNIEIHVPLAN